MMKKALIFHGGWQGHEPKLVSKRFANLLKKEDFEVFVYDTLECLGDKDFLLSMDLIIPMWTQGDLTIAMPFPVRGCRIWGWACRCSWRHVRLLPLVS